MNKIKRALISVYDKANLLDLAKALIGLDVDIISTGGTAQFLTENGVPVIGISEVTDFPEILGGRVKTLHPNIHGGLLAKRDDEAQMAELKEHHIEPIDLVVVNLYPFEKTVANPDVTLPKALENIDIGGPCMIRAAAKNFKNVCVVIDPSQYDSVIQELKENNGALSVETREKCALEAFRLTSYYDAIISLYLSGLHQEAAGLPDTYSLRLDKVQDLRYGENPHQKAAFYRASGVEKEVMRQLHGKELSFNNLLDMNAAIGLASEFVEPCAVILKHNNPCGAAIDIDITSAYQKALSCDPVSAYGGIVALNRPVEQELAEKLADIFLEVIIAPEFLSKAMEILTKKKNIRLMTLLPGVDPNAYDIKKIYGGYLLQNVDSMTENEKEYKVVTTRQPTEAEWKAMRFGWKICKWVKSNAVIFFNEYQTLGIGAGQMSRVDSSKIAVMKAEQAGHPLRGSVVASDAYFPFRDGVDAAAQAGATAIIQPGGSVRDPEVIDAANEHQMAMVFTGFRHFRH
jgi:phosphoribosylaminoimidazolecarboxamide formyltransferase / IMP cyclohydrolase